MTHWSDADADPKASAGIAAPRAVFEAATRDLPGDRSLCNSAATLRHGAEAEVRGEWVRPGIMLYGSSPDHPLHSADAWQLRPAMTLQAELIATQELRAGETVGYGSLYTAARDMRLGVVACGYADGYPRVAPGSNERGTPVLVDGVRTRTVGRVSMDMITVDLTPVPQARVGSLATLWGRADNGALLPIDEVAEAAGTLGYELMCGRAPRVPVRAVAG
jgi:alanine racemase